MKLQEYYGDLLGKTYRLGNGTKIALSLYNIYFIF